MSSRISAQLAGRLFDCLRQGCPALLLTVDAANFPHTAFTWAAAPSPSGARFGVDHGSVTQANLAHRSQVALQVIGQGNLVYLIKGQARQIKAQIEAAPFKIAMFELEVAEVKDQAWPGVTVAPLGYRWPAGKEAEMAAMERAVYAELLTEKIN